MNDQSNANDGGTNPAQDESLSEFDLIEQMSGEGPQQEEEPEEPEEESEDAPEADETESEEESEEAEEEESDEEPEEIDGINLSDLTDEQWEVVRKKLKSGAAARISALTAKLKAKDETISALQSKQPELAEAPEPVESRFLTDVDSPDKLKEKVASLKKLAKDTDRLLDDYEDYALADVIEVGGKSYTKKQLKELSRDVREALLEGVPYLQSKFQRNAIIEKDVAEVEARVKKEVQELSDENSEVAKTFKGLTESDLFQKIFTSFPEARPVLTLLSAHGTKGLLGKSAKTAAKPAATGKIPKAKPPSSPSGAAASAPARTGDPKGKAAEVHNRRFNETGSPEDLVKAMSEA